MWSLDRSRTEMVTGAVRNVRDVADTSSLVPPALLEDTQTFKWTLCGIYVPLNEDSTGEGRYALDALGEPFLL